MNKFVFTAAGFFLIFLLMGCGSISANVYFQDIDKYHNIPSYRIPVKFCITNHKWLSQYCVQNYPDLFTDDPQSAIAVKFTYPKGNDIFTNRVYATGGTPLIFFLSILSLGLIPDVASKEKNAYFKIDLPMYNTQQKITQKTFCLYNIGIVGLILPTPLLLPKSTAIYSGCSWGFGESGCWYTTVHLNKGQFARLSRVLLHMLSLVPKEKIENYYLSHVVPPAEILK